MELYGDCVECSGERQCFDSGASPFLQVSQMSSEVEWCSRRLFSQVVKGSPHVVYTRNDLGRFSAIEQVPKRPANEHNGLHCGQNVSIVECNSLRHF